MGKSVTKTVKVSESKAAEWNEYVEETAEVDSVSHLIRLSVQKEMNNSHKRTESPSAKRQTDVSGEVLTNLRQIQTGLSDLEERMSALEAMEQSEESYSLKKAVWELLPEEPEQVVDGEIPPVYGDGAEGLDSLDVTTAHEIAQKLGAEVSDVQNTLDELVESTGQVQASDENHSGNHYWKKGA
jgi:hypothetical protein